MRSETFLKFNMADKAATLAAACEAVQGMRLVTDRDFQIINGPAGDVHWQQLNLKLTQRYAHNLKLVVDVIEDVPGPFNAEQIKAWFESDDDANIPSILKAVEGLPAHILQFAVVRSGANTFTVLKLYHFEEPINRQVVNSLKSGVVYQIDWGDGTDRQTKRLAFQHLWARLGGFQRNCQSLQAQELRRQGSREGAGKRLLSPDEIDKGYDLIRDCHNSGQLQSDDNSLNRWMKKQMNDPTSDLFGWSKADILDGFKSLQSQSDGAKVQTEYPLDLRDCDDWLAPLLLVLLPKLLQTSLLLMGENSIGKTALATILAMAFSRYWIHRNGKSVRASFRLTQDIDFLKGIPGSQEQPVIVDDGGLGEWLAKTLKAFLDMKAREAAVRARWTRTSFVCGQLRIGTDNPYNEDVDLSGAPMTLRTFLELIQPCFPGLSRANMMAVLKRANVVVNTRTHVVLKVAAEERFVVLEIPPGRMYIKPGAPDILTNFFTHQRIRPGAADRIEEEQRVLRGFLDGPAPAAPLSPDDGETLSAGERQDESSEHGELGALIEGSPPKRHRMKEELTESPRQMLLGVVDVSDTQQEPFDLSGGAEDPS